MTNFNFGRCAITGTAVALIAGCGGSQPPIRTSVGAGASDTYANHHTFHYTGKKQVFSVPASVTNIKVIAIGGDGAPNYGRAGYGGRVSAVIPVTPYEDKSGALYTARLLRVEPGMEQSSECDRANALVAGDDRAHVAQHDVAFR